MLCECKRDKTFNVCVYALCNVFDRRHMCVGPIPPDGCVLCVLAYLKVYTRQAWMVMIASLCKTIRERVRRFAHTFRLYQTNRWDATQLIRRGCVRLAHMADVLPSKHVSSTFFSLIPNESMTMCNCDLVERSRTSVQIKSTRILRWIPHGVMIDGKKNVRQDKRGHTFGASVWGFNRIKNTYKHKHTRNRFVFVYGSFECAARSLNVRGLWSVVRVQDKCSDIQCIRILSNRFQFFFFLQICICIWE